MNNLKDLTKGLRALFLGHTSRKRASVTPYKTPNSNTAARNTGSRRATVSPNNGNNRTRNAKQRRESCLNKCKSSYNNSESKSASILKKYLNCCKHCRES